MRRKEIECRPALAVWLKSSPGLPFALDAAPPSDRQCCLDRHPSGSGSRASVSTLLSALNGRDKITGPANLVLLVSFWMPWYSIGPFSADGLRAHGWLFTAVLSAIVLVLYVVVTAFEMGDLAQPFRMSKDQFLVLLPSVNLVLVGLAFLLKPTGLSWSWGAFLALAAAIVAFLPNGIPYLQEKRRH